jgi:hypothetical protein
MRLHSAVFILLSPTAVCLFLCCPISYCVNIARNFFKCS